MLRVLVADDSAVARLSLARGMRAAGLDVEERESVAAALSVDVTSLGCAVLDLELGDGAGTEVAARLREVAPELPIAFFSSAPPDGLRAHAASFGPIFAKPDELADAIAWARRSIGSRGAGERA